MVQRPAPAVYLHDCLLADWVTLSSERDDVDRLYVSRKEGGRGLASIEDSVDASIQRLEDYIEKHE